MIYDRSLTRKAVQVFKQSWKGSSAWLEGGPHPSGVDAFSSSRLIGFVLRLREILFPKILLGWRSSDLRSLLASFGRDFTARPLAISGLFFSSYLLLHTLLSPYQSWAFGKVVVEGFLVLLPLSGLLVEVDLKSLLGSSLISKAWAKTSGFSDVPSTKPLQPNSRKPALFRKRDVR
jgi:hypothetical protein